MYAYVIVNISKFALFFASFGVSEWDRLPMQYT